MGHFDQGELAQRLIRVTRPLDMEIVYRLLDELGERLGPGEHKLGGFPVRFRDGYIECIWMAVGRIPEAVELGRRLHEETGCDVLEVRSRQVLHVGTSQ
jgi:hypothetical protein